MLRRTELGWILPDIKPRAELHLQRGEWLPQTFNEIVGARLNEDDARIAVIDSHVRLSRRDLYESALRLGAALARRGLRRGSVVSMQLPNWNEACVINLACALYGFAVNPLLPMYRERELSFILSQCRSDAVFIPGLYRNFDYSDLMAGISFETKDDNRIFTVRASNPGKSSYESLIAEDASEDPGIDRADPSEIKTVLYTSGSTGRPKGVLHSHHTIHALVRQAGAFWDIRETDTLFIPSPVGHIGGSIYAFEFPWLIGTTALLMESWNPAQAVELIDREQATFCAGATPFLEGLLDSARSAGTKLPSLRRFVCGGASVPASLVERALSHFDSTVVSRAYGSSEVPVICPGLRTRRDALLYFHTDGEIAADVRIVDEDDREVPPLESGNIQARSARMFVGYIDTDHEIGQFTGDGFFRMGDVGRLYDQRFLEITGRKKDIIIRMGENISPREIENILLEHGSIKEAAIVGVPNERTGERVVAFVTLNDATPFDLDIMRGFLARCGIARQKFPEELHILEEMPTNTIGKILKEELKRLHGSAR